MSRKNITQGIYTIVNTVNGHRYIGSSVEIEERRTAHYRLLRKNIHHNEPLQRAWKKYGEGAFEFHVVEVVADRTLLTTVEQRYLDGASDQLYNVSPFAHRPTNAGRPHSAETKAKIGIANRLSHKGVKLSPRHRANAAASHVGLTRSPATRARMRAAQRGRVPVRAIEASANVRRGKPLSVLHKNRIAEGLRGLKRSPRFCAALGARQKGKKKSPNAVAAMMAARWTPEARAKQSALLRGKAPVAAIAARARQFSERERLNG
jgi:group I intron endonuclease